LLTQAVAERESLPRLPQVAPKTTERNVTFILAIDLGKFNSMCCMFDTETQEYSFRNARTTREYLTLVLKSLQIDLVVMEACGPSGWISDLCHELKLKTLVCSTNEEA